MFASSAVLLLLRTRPEQDLPPLLRPILFSPAARWLTMSLRRLGVRRFFALAEEDCLSLAAACLPEDAEVCSILAPERDSRLTAFAAGCEGLVITITEPVWLSNSACADLTGDEFLTPAGEPMGVYRVSAEDLSQGGLDALDCGDYYSPRNEPEVQLLPLTDERAFFRAQQLGREDTLCRLMAEGVRLIDPAATYAEAGAAVGRGSVILPNTILRGEVIAGENCTLGPNTMLTECVLGNDCSVNASQVSFVCLPDGSRVGPFEDIRS